MADEVVLLMLTRHALESPIPAFERGEALIALGSLPGLFYYHQAKVEPQLTLEDDPLLDHVLFALRDLLGHCWLENERSLLNWQAHSVDMKLLATWRASVWSTYFDHTRRARRLELLRPFCDLYARLFSNLGYARTVVDAIEMAGNFTSVSERQRVYGHMLSAYKWVTDLNDLFEQARRTMGWDEEHETLQIFRSQFARVPQTAREQARTLLDTLSFAI